MDINILVNKSKLGDGNAFWELIEHKKHSLYRTAFWYVKNETDAMDIVSEAVYKAFISLHQLKNNEFFHTWLMRILIHCAFDFMKANRDSLPYQGDLSIIPEKPADTLEDILDLRLAVAALDEKHRTVIILKYFEDMTLVQVGEVLDMPVGTVKTYLHRALQHLRIKLEEV